MLNHSIVHDTPCDSMQNVVGTEFSQQGDMKHTAKGWDTTRIIEEGAKNILGPKVPPTN